MRLLRIPEDLSCGYFLNFDRDGSIYENITISNQRSYVLRRPTRTGLVSEDVKTFKIKHESTLKLYDQVDKIPIKYSIRQIRWRHASLYQLGKGNHEGSRTMFQRIGLVDISLNLHNPP